MGRKGDNKRKPKKSRPFATTDVGGSSNAHAGVRSQVQTLVKDKGALLNRGSTNPSAGSNKRQKKH
jgi:hypothetical protein